MPGQWTDELHALLLVGTGGAIGSVARHLFGFLARLGGLPADQAYNATMYILASFLVLGFFCNLLVKPVAQKHFMGDAELAAERAKAHEASAAAAAPENNKASRNV